MIYDLLQVKNCFTTIVNWLSVLTLFQLSIGDFFYIRSMPTTYLRMYKVCKPKITKLGQGVDVRAHCLSMK